MPEPLESIVMTLEMCKPTREEKVGVVFISRSDVVSIKDVRPDSLCEKAGVRRGDVVLSINGEGSITTAQQAADLVRDAEGAVLLCVDCLRAPVDWAPIDATARALM